MICALTHNDSKYLEFPVGVPGECPRISPNFPEFSHEPQNFWKFCRAPKPRAHQPNTRTTRHHPHPHAAHQSCSGICIVEQTEGRSRPCRIVTALARWPSWAQLSRKKSFEIGTCQPMELGRSAIPEMGGKILGVIYEESHGGEM